MTVDLRHVVESHDVVVCAGSGGVGKTTTAAAIALWGALQGRRTVVLTIDPARRLADSLALPMSGGGEVEVPPSLIERYGLRPGAPLAAMMLDQKGAWDALVERHAPNAEARRRILANRFYQHLSQSFAGSQEYMAIEELGNLRESGRYDLIVVDTPPSRHALEFLEAPQRIADFLDKKIVKWFVKPYMSAGWSTVRLLNRTVGFVFHKLEEATGVGTMAEVSDFFGAFSGVFDGFEARVERVTRVLRSPKTAFVLVSSPEEQVLEEGEYLSRKMAELGVKLRGVVFNRVHHEFSGELDARQFPHGEIREDDRSALVRVLSAAGLDDARLAGALAENFAAHQALARGDALRLESFVAGLSRQIPVVQVPNFSSDVHDLGGLASMHPHLFGPGGPGASSA